MVKNKILVKTANELEVMAEGGRKLVRIKKELLKSTKERISAFEIEKLADKLITETGGEPSFKKVPGYSWATCINVNEGVVHGIPKRKVVFKKGDVVSLDLGLFYKGFHTDTSFTVGIKVDRGIKDFLYAGKIALKKAIGKAIPGNRIFDVSKAIEDELNSRDFNPIRALVGHGIGRSLHEEPPIPCFVAGKREESPVIPEGAVLAIEVMYTQGNSDVVVNDDGWTISTAGGKISALFEETVAVTKKGPVVLTDSSSVNTHQN